MGYTVFYPDWYLQISVDSYEQIHTARAHSHTHLSEHTLCSLSHNASLQPGY